MSPVTNVGHSAYDALPILTVSGAIQLCNEMFGELDFQVEGEVANFTLSRGKFVFFDLKDETEEARLGCFCMAFQLTVPLEDGMRVVVQAQPGLYQKSGQFRLTVRHVQAKGEGSVKRAFELLKITLEKEGLFSPTRKRPLPRFPKRVGVIASTESAGYGDFMRLIQQRLPGIQFEVVPVPVQGVLAERSICEALEWLNGYRSPDVIVLIRGGGSQEDLHAFNSEQVARAIVRSKSPILVGVGHERDVTIADFCADLRAATPSNAAQLLLPTKEEVVEQVLRLVQTGQSNAEQGVQRMKHKIGYQLRHQQESLLFRLTTVKQRVETIIHTIENLSPTAILKRGFSITCTEDGQLVTDIQQLVIGNRLQTRFSKGSIQSIVDTMQP